MDTEVLRRAPLFASLDDEAFAALTDEITEVDLPRGATLFHEGDQGDRLYFIISGKVKLGRTASDGRENLVAVMGPGEVFGEIRPAAGIYVVAGLLKAEMKVEIEVTARLAA